MLRAETLLRQTSIFTSSVLLSSAISGLLALIIARLLSPELYGVFQGIQVFWQYAVYTHLGTPWTMQQEIARREGTGKVEEAQQTADVTLTFVIWSSMLLLVGVTLLAWARGWPFAPAITALSMLALAVRQVYGVCQSMLTARQRFWIAGRADVVASVVNLALTATLTWRFGLPGLLIGQVGWAVFGVALLARTGRLRFHWRPAWSPLAAQVRLGVQFTVNSFLQVTARNCGRLVILTMAGTATLGYYGVAMLVASYAELVGGAVGRSVLPSMVGVYEQQGDPEAMRSYVLVGGRVLGALLAIGVGGAALLLPLFVRLILPRYLAGVPAAQWLLFGAIFLLLRSSIEPFYVAMLTLYRTFPAQMAGVGLAVVAAYLAARGGLPLAAVAAGATAGYLLVSVLLLGYAYRHLERSISGLVRYVLAVHWPACYCGALVVLLSLTMGSGATTLPARAAWTLARLGVYSLLCLPVFRHADRQGHLVRRLRGHTGTLPEALSSPKGR
jgi:O-antigen/teichoic acid export membrane protein